MLKFTKFVLVACRLHETANNSFPNVAGRVIAILLEYTSRQDRKQYQKSEEGMDFSTKPQRNRHSRVLPTGAAKKEDKKGSELLPCVFHFMPLLPL
jgi:hypothetical protein